MVKKSSLSECNFFSWLSCSFSLDSCALIFFCASCISVISRSAVLLPISLPLPSYKLVALSKVGNIVPFFRCSQTSLLLTVPVFFHCLKDFVNASTLCLYLMESLQTFWKSLLPLDFQKC